MNRLFFLRFILVLIFPLTVLAQNEDPIPKPQAPFVGQMPDDTTWTIKVTHQGPAVPLPPGTRRVDQLISTKSGSSRELVALWSDGSRSDLWFFRGYRLEQNPGSDHITVTSLKGGTDAQNVDFTDFQWLDLSNYVGVEDKNSVKCYFFKDQVKFKYQRLILDCSADINVKTKLPVAWDQGSNHYELVSTASATLSALPPAFAAALKAYQEAAAAARFYKK
jgi:hypothetical protein